ncbi:MAG: hypothetical protein HGA76_06355 [Candidatus Firestonebacteria bacterium]|nr:hypothetical protein [Candidatus Firestonebacteria bacterium]
MKKNLLLAIAAVAVSAMAANMAMAAPVTTIVFPIHVFVVADTVNIEGNANVAAAMDFGVVGAGANKVSQGKGTDANEPYINIINRGSNTIALQVLQDAGANSVGGSTQYWTALLGGTPGVTATGPNQYRLAGVFTNYFGTEAAWQANTGNTGTGYAGIDFWTLSAANFDATDVFQIGLTTATNTVYGIDAQPQLGVKGYNIPTAAPGAEYLGTRCLRMSFDAPTSGTFTYPMAINVTVHAL